MIKKDNPCQNCKKVRGSIHRPGCVSCPKSLTIKLEMDLDRAILLMRACEVIARIGMGQFKDMVELLNPSMPYDEGSVIERDLKNKIYPELVQSYHSMSSSKCPEECQVAWDAYQHIRREISWYRHGKDWRHDNRNYTDGMMGVNFDEPYKASKLPGDFKVEKVKEEFIGRDISSKVGFLGRKISREEALKLSKSILKKAERKRKV